MGEKFSARAKPENFNTYAEAHDHKALIIPEISAKHICLITRASAFSPTTIFDKKPEKHFKKDDKEKANSILRYLISVSQGYQFKAPVRVRFSVLLHLKEDLERMNAIWQVARAKNWINRFIQKNRDALQLNLTSREWGGV